MALFLNSDGEFREPEDPNFAHCARTKGVGTCKPSAGEGKQVPALYGEEPRRFFR